MSARRIPASVKERRRDVMFAVALVCGVAVLAWVVITMQQLSHDLRTANDARDALATQVESLGHKPVAGPPGSRGEAGKSVVGPRGPRGSPGPSGSPGASGSPGKNGSTGDSGSPGPVGASGSPGVNGVEGSPGPAGVQGEPGPAGADGKDGTNGQPPDGWTYTDPSGVTYDCERASDFDPDHPRYTCQATSTPSDMPPGKGLLGAAALVSTASYRRLGGGPHA